MYLELDVGFLNGSVMSVAVRYPNCCETTRRPGLKRSRSTPVDLQRVGPLVDFSIPTLGSEPPPARWGLPDARKWSASDVGTQ